ncbi:MAG: L-aspartate oxidase [Ruminococcus sp.]
MKTDILIVGTGVGGLFCALNLPEDKEILMITKDETRNSDSFLAQGGICMLRGEEDYDSYFEDTMKAGHYENREESVDIMIRSSQEIIRDLIGYGVEFAKENGHLAFTREGGHSRPRILFHEDITGEEITKKLLAQVEKRKNVKILEKTTMIDLVCRANICYGIVCRKEDGSLTTIEAKETVLACGGVGGLYEHSTNFPHLTGDGLAVALKHGIELENIDYVQIHPTTLYSRKPGRRFLISESVRGEGAVLYNADHKRFVDELLPRDLLTAAIRRQMEQDHTPYVWLSMEHIPEEKIKSHFPNIYRKCLEEGYDVTKECIPVVPAQHYFMGGIKVDKNSRTSMEQLYAVGETSCNGVHGANRLASNSLLESLVFAKRSAAKIREEFSEIRTDEKIWKDLDLSVYSDYEKIKEKYRQSIEKETERMRKQHEQSNYHEAKCG